MGLLIKSSPPAANDSAKEDSSVIAVTNIIGGSVDRRAGRRAQVDARVAFPKCAAGERLVNAGPDEFAAAHRSLLVTRAGG